MLSGRGRERLGVRLVLGEIVRDGNTPIWRQIADQITAGIRSGEYPPGSRIPSSYDLRVHYGVAYETTRAAVRRLVEDGLVRSVHGKGVFVLSSSRSGVALVGDAVALLDEASRVFDAVGDDGLRDAANEAAHALAVSFPGLPFAGLRGSVGGLGVCAGWSGAGVRCTGWVCV
jgi:GntR family transcriptional regulator